MTYHVVCTVALGDPERALFYPGHVGPYYLRVTRPPAVAAYATTSRRQAARVLLAAYRGFGKGDYPPGRVRPRDYAPQTGDVLLTLVAPVPGTSATPYPPLVTAAYFPQVFPVQKLPRVPAFAFSSLRRLELGVGLTLARQDF